MTKRPSSKPAWPVYVTAGPFLFFSGQLGRHPKTGLLCTTYEDLNRVRAAPAGGLTWVDAMEGPVGAQAIAIYERYRTLFKRLGGDFSGFVRYHVYQRDKRFFPVFDHIRRQYETSPPSSTAVGVGRFEPTGRAWLCMDGIAANPRAQVPIGSREVLGGAASHAAAAFFSHVVGMGPYLFVAGQIPLDSARPGSPLIRNYDDIPESGRFLKVGRSHEDTRNGPIAAQSWFTYDLIRQHLEAVGSSMDSILSLIVYLQDMRDFPTFHRVHERVFGSHPPALTVIEVGEVGHKGTLIEIEPTAVLPGKGAKRSVFNTEHWRAPAHMSQIVEGGGLAYFSGIVGVDGMQSPITSLQQLPMRLRARARQGFARSPAALQCIAILDELDGRFRAAGRDLSVIVQLTVYVSDIDDFAVVQMLLADAFGKRLPTLTALEVSAPAPVRGARLSIAGIAWFGEGKVVAHGGMD